MSFPKEQIETLWAPWRIEYFEQPRPQGDFLLEAAQSTDDAKHLVVARFKSTFLIMNRYPYASGHLMVVPYRKVADLDALADHEKLELLTTAQKAQALLKEVMRAQGFNIGLNLGTCAGAGVTDHLHLHVVPRWNGDTNFMPMLAQTKVIPEALEGLYQKLREKAATLSAL